MNFELARRDRRARGSTLILVLAALLLSMLLGIAYLEVVRQDRKATANILSQADIDMVLDSVIDLALNRIEGDLGIDDTAGSPTLGNYFAKDGDGDGQIEEPYDYYGPLDRWLAGTSLESNANNTPWPQITLLSDPNTVGYFDGDSAAPFDAVQNTLVPDDEATSPLVLRNAANGDPIPTGAADSDGDGIIDSRHEVAPIPTLRGVKYFFSARIIDNSSMLNANVAMSQVNAAGNYTNAQAPRWWNPSELDMGRFMFESVATAQQAAAMGELQTYLNGRLGVVNPAPTPWLIPDPGIPAKPDGLAGSRHHFWRFGASVYDNYGRVPAVPFGGPFAYTHLDVAEHEPEFRYRNGLNREGVTLAEGTMPTLTRTAANNELTFADALANRGFTAPGLNDPADYLKDQNAANKTSEPRNMITFASGASIFRPARTGETTAGRKLKPDLSWFIADPGQHANLRNEIANVLLTPPAFVPPTAALSMLHPTAVPANAQTYAAQMAANIADYTDNDNTGTATDNNLRGVKVSIVPGSPVRYGMEALPFISEIYIQAQYKKEQNRIPNVNPLVPGPWMDLPAGQIWVKEAQLAYAIEIRNPFTKPINLNNLYIRIGVGGAQIQLSTYLPFPGTLQPNQALILYQNNANETGAGGNGLVTTATTDEIVMPPGMGEPNDIKIAVHFNELDNAVGVGGALDPLNGYTGYVDPIDNAPTEFALIAKASVENAPVEDVVYQRVTMTPTLWPAVQVDMLPTTLTNYGYRKHSIIGHGLGLNPMTTRDTDFARATRPATPAQPPQGRTANVDEHLGQENKTGGTLTAGPGNILGNVQILFSTDGELHQVGELAMITYFGPVKNAMGTFMTIPEVWNGKVNMNGLYLDFGFGPQGATSAAPNVSAGDAGLVRHEHLLMDHFVTHAPNQDGVDNDGDGMIDESRTDGIDNNANMQIDELAEAEEEFIPGTINLNTASQELLEKILPVPNTVKRKNIASAIIYYRTIANNMNNATTGRGRESYAPAPGMSPNPPNLVYRQNVLGFASLGEVFNLNQVRLNAGGANGGRDYSNVEDYAAAPADGGVQLDFYSNPGAGSDGISNDMEEQTLLGRWLSQVGSVRSDIFTAYIMVRGYKDDPNAPNDPTKYRLVAQKRILLVIDRSRVTAKGTGMRVLAKYVYP